MVTRVVAGIGDAGFLGGRPAGITDPGYKAGEKSPAAIPKASGSNFPSTRRRDWAIIKSTARRENSKACCIDHIHL
jgi:hypothetical protein